MANRTMIEAEEPLVELDAIYPDPTSSEFSNESISSFEPAVQEEEPAVQEEEPAVQEEPSVQEEEPAIPKVVFIVPYRDRAQHLEVFTKHMQSVLDGLRGYRIYYIHQLDSRGFNRGAMKNIGFRMVRNKWPNDYRSITLVFNDIDTMAKYPGQFNFETEFGTIKHFYGFEYALGGIVSIKAGDFERLNGFPNFWTWGFEDNMLQSRAKKAGIAIDRSKFVPFGNPNVINITHSEFRLINRQEFSQYMKSTKEGISYIHGLVYGIDESTGFVNVHQFFTGREENTLNTFTYDLKNGPAPFGKLHCLRNGAAMPMHIS
jgi:N-terminal region of glycosyl transferase group 7/N-terminal domain of galactosyltransferase